PWGAQAQTHTAVQAAPAPPLVSEAAHPAETVIPVQAETLIPEPAPEAAETPDPALQETAPEASYEGPEGGVYETPESAAPPAHSPENVFAFEAPPIPDPAVAVPAPGGPEAGATFPAAPVEPVAPDLAPEPQDTEGAVPQPEDALIVVPEAEPVPAAPAPVLDAQTPQDAPVAPEADFDPEFHPEPSPESHPEAAPQVDPDSEPQAGDAAPDAHVEALSIPADEFQALPAATAPPVDHLVDPASPPADAAVVQLTESAPLAEPQFEAVAEEEPAPVLENAGHTPAETQLPPVAEAPAVLEVVPDPDPEPESEPVLAPVAPSDQAPAPAEPELPVEEPAAAPAEETVAFAEPVDQPQLQAEPLLVAPPQAEPVGQFVPVDGTVPTAPHLAPTPPHGLALVPEAEYVAETVHAAETAPGTTEPEIPEPTASEPTAPEAVTEADAPAPDLAPVILIEEPEAVPDPDADAVQVAQQAEDLDTTVADQEENRAAVEDVQESPGPAAPGYDDAEREAVLKVMRERRDIRNGFRSDPIPHDVLLRVLEAAHTAPSVGHSQPWDFVVIRSAETRGTMHELAARQREAYAKSLPKGRAKQFKELKIEAILDTPVNIVVTADPTRGGRHTLGRHTQPQMAPYSSALAVENLWLAARAEGLGVGWVSFFDEREMVRTLGLPEHLEVVAYLCVGYVDEFPEEPELMQAGWSKRRPLSWVVHEETYGRRALPGEEPHDLLAETVANIRPLDAKALGEAWERQKRMTKPAGALG
ncbi:5,6-dimethylbenzimidazole synthase, partial [Streptomyces turgidiscabies]